MSFRLKRPVRDIAVVGVGGQGIILATDVIATVFLEAGYDVKKSEVHGMAQRGGSVQSHVRRHPERVYSPLIAERGADVLVSFEAMEALRYASIVADDGLILYNTLKIPTSAMSTGQSPYPRDIDERLKQGSPKVLSVDALRLAQDLGNLRVANTVLVGALSQFIDIPQSLWGDVLSARVPKAAVEVNLRALAAGREIAAEVF